MFINFVKKAVNENANIPQTFLPFEVSCNMFLGVPVTSTDRRTHCQCKYNLMKKNKTVKTMSANIENGSEYQKDKDDGQYGNSLSESCSVTSYDARIPENYQYSLSDCTTSDYYNHKVKNCSACIQCKQCGIVRVTLRL